MWWTCGGHVVAVGCPEKKQRPAPVRPTSQALRAPCVPPACPLRARDGCPVSLGASRIRHLRPPLCHRVAARGAGRAASGRAEALARGARGGAGSFNLSTPLRIFLPKTADPLPPAPEQATGVVDVPRHPLGDLSGFPLSLLQEG